MLVYRDSVPVQAPTAPAGHGSVSEDGRLNGSRATLSCMVLAGGAGDGRTRR
jgi:hypothetical protein